MIVCVYVCMYVLGNSTGMQLYRYGAVSRFNLICMGTCLHKGLAVGTYKINASGEAHN